MIFWIVCNIPTGLATELIVVARVRCSVGNQLAANIGGAFKINGCTTAPINCPNQTTPKLFDKARTVAYNDIQ